MSKIHRRRIVNMDNITIVNSLEKVSYDYSVEPGVTDIDSKKYELTEAVYITMIDSKKDRIELPVDEGLMIHAVFDYKNMYIRVIFEPNTYMPDEDKAKLLSKTKELLASARYMVMEEEWKA